MESTTDSRRVSRRQPLALPAVVAPIAHAVMEPRQLSLPQLEHVGDQAIAAPVGRPDRSSRADATLDVGDSLLQRFAAGDRARLRRCDRADLAIARARREVRIAGGGVDLLDAALDAD